MTHLFFNFLITRYCPECRNDASEVVLAGEKLKESKKKAKMASANSSSQRDWGKVGPSWFVLSCSPAVADTCKNLKTDVYTITWPSQLKVFHMFSNLLECNMCSTKRKVTGVTSRSKQSCLLTA